MREAAGSPLGEVLDHLTRASAERRTAQMGHLSASRVTASRRDADPHHLWCASSAPHLIAHSHRRRELRPSVDECIRAPSVIDHPFRLPLGFDVDGYVRDALVVMRGRQIGVELGLDRSTAAWARDRI